MKESLAVFADTTSDPIVPPKADRILIVKLSSMGDLFHILPAVRQLKAATGAKIDWVTHAEYVELVRCFSDVDRVLSYPRRNWLGEIAPFIADLWNCRYDLVLDLQGLLKSAIPSRLARSRQVIGPSYRREGARIFYSSVAGHLNKNRHAVDEALDVVRFLGCPEQEPEFPVCFPKVRRLESGVRVALAPFSRWSTKNWSLERFAQMARELNARIPITFYLMGGPSDEEAGRRLARAMTGIHVVFCCGGLSLIETGSLLQEMDLAITVDSGPMHMAAALGVPILALFGPTDPARTGPYGSKHRVLWVDGLPCRPCFSNMCARKDHACLARIFPSQVVDTAAEILKFIPHDRFRL